MKKRVLAQSVAVGTLILGAAGALSGCASGSPRADATVAASQGSSVAADAEAEADTPASCASGQLSVQYRTAGSDMGHRGAVVVFTNDGPGACTLSGYPGAAVTDHPGHVVLSAQRSLTGYLGGTGNVTAVTLAKGERASALIEWDAATSDGRPAPAGTDCPGMKGGKLLVTPPNTQAAIAFPAPSDLCSGFAVHPVVPNTSGVTSD